MNFAASGKIFAKNEHRIYELFKFQNTNFGITSKQYIANHFQKMENLVE